MAMGSLDANTVNLVPNQLKMIQKLDMPIGPFYEQKVLFKFSVKDLLIENVISNAKWKYGFLFFFLNWLCWNKTWVTTYSGFPFSDERRTSWIDPHSCQRVFKLVNSQSCLYPSHIKMDSGGFGGAFGGAKASGATDPLTFLRRPIVCMRVCCLVSRIITQPGTL